jgi:hypothetical protein
MLPPLLFSTFLPPVVHPLAGFPSRNEQQKDLFKALGALGKSKKRMAEINGVDVSTNPCGRPHRSVDLSSRARYGGVA